MSELEQAYRALFGRPPPRQVAPIDTVPPIMRPPLPNAAIAAESDGFLPINRQADPTMTRPAPRQPKERSEASSGAKMASKTSKRNASSAKGIKRKSHREKQEAHKHAPRGTDRPPPATPSAASGGVPNAIPSYLRQASLAPSRLSAPRTLLVVMDLNGTLLYRPDRSKSHKFIERPYAKRFTQYCIDTFKVLVWSSARPENVATMCSQLLGDSKGTDHVNEGQQQQDQSSTGASSIHNGMDSAEATRLYRDRVVAVWGRDKFGLSQGDFFSRVQCYKRLQSVWADPDVRASHPDAAGPWSSVSPLWDQSNTVLVDDSVEKARTEPFNLLRIPEFAGDLQEPGDVLPQVHDYLNELAWQADISRYIRENPFKLRDDYSLEANAQGRTDFNA